MDFKEINPKFIWTFAILVSVGIIITSFYLIINEILEARKECNTLDGEYIFKILEGHFCNGKSFIKYNSCQVVRNKKGCNMVWTFEDSIGKINLSEFTK